MIITRSRHQQTNVHEEDNIMKKTRATFENTLSKGLLEATRAYEDISVIGFFEALFPCGSIDTYLRYEYTYYFLHSDFFPKTIKKYFENMENHDAMIKRLDEFASLFIGRETNLQNAMLNSLRCVEDPAYSTECVTDLINYIQEGPFRGKKVTESLYYYLFLAVRKNLPHRLNTPEEVTTNSVDSSIDYNIISLVDSINNMSNIQALKVFFQFTQMLNMKLQNEPAMLDFVENSLHM